MELGVTSGYYFYKCKTKNDLQFRLILVANLQIFTQMTVKALEVVLHYFSDRNMNMHELYFILLKMIFQFDKNKRNIWLIDEWYRFCHFGIDGKVNRFVYYNQYFSNNQKTKLNKFYIFFLKVVLLKY